MTQDTAPGNPGNREPVTDAALVALVDRLRSEHAERTPRDAYRLTRSAIRRWRRSPFLAEIVPTPKPRARRGAPTTCEA